MRVSRLLALVVCLLPACSDDTAAHDFASDVEECKANLHAIYGGLTVYRHEKGHLPERGGVRFFVELIGSGVWENDAAHARLLTCPGVPVERLALAGKEPESWFRDLEGIDGTWSGYAGRDIVKFPLGTFPGPGTEAVLACGNRGSANHDGVTNVLMSDGSILSLELATEIELGNLPADATRIVVGPESPLGELQKLSLD